MRAGSYLIYGICFVIAAAITTLSYNIVSIILDPFGVVWPSITHRAGLWGDQSRFIKTEYLKKHPREYTGFILGNSRGFFVDATIPARLSGHKYYNLSVIADTVFSYQTRVQWLLRTQEVKHVVLLFSFDQFTMIDSRYGPLQTREYPDLTGESWLSYYWTFSGLPYTTFHANLADALHLGHRLLSAFGHWIGEYQSPYGSFIAENPIVDLPTGNNPGRIMANESHRKRVEDEFGHGEAAKATDKTIMGVLSGPFIEGEFSSFHQIVSDLQKANVDMTCVLVPLPARTLRLVESDRYGYWLSFISNECGEFWDFSDVNSITSDKYNYLEWSHFTSQVGDLMFLRIFGGHSAELDRHPDFGLLVHKEDLPLYLHHWRESFSLTLSTISSASKK